MAVRLSSSLLSSLENLHPVVPNQKHFKRACKFVDSTSVPVASPLSFRPRKRAALLMVRAVVVEATDRPKWWEKNARPNMIDIHSNEEFLSALSEAGDRLVIIEFYGTWCASCRALFPKLCKTAVEHREILFLKVNFDENKAMCKSMEVKVLPYFLFYRGPGEQVAAFSCSLAKFQKLKDAIEMYNPASCSNNLVKVEGAIRPDSSSSVREQTS